MISNMDLTKDNSIQRPISKSTLLKTTTYADYEFSDEDVGIVTDFEFNSLANNNRNLSQTKRTLRSPPNKITPSETTTKRTGHVLGSSMTSKSTYAHSLYAHRRALSDARSSTLRSARAKETPLAAKFDENKNEGVKKNHARSPKYVHDIDSKNRKATLIADSNCPSLPIRIDKRKLIQATICLDEDDDLMKHVIAKPKNAYIDVDDDANKDISELADEPSSQCVHIKTAILNMQKINNEVRKTSPLPTKPNWLELWKASSNPLKKIRKEEVNKTKDFAEQRIEERRAAELDIHERFKDFNIYEREFKELDGFCQKAAQAEEPEFIELTPGQKIEIETATFGRPDQVLISKFNLDITRHDIQTLHVDNWLNDKVINFYMCLLTERGERKHKSHGLPRVYAMNTFFMPRLMQDGHSGVKRWTRKVDIFSKDIIPIPVLVGSNHWCMAIVHLRKHTIKYYDSLGVANPHVLKAIENYLKEESMDKRNKPFDTTNFRIGSVRNVPEQMNASDCGVFSCMFAEYITRKKPITFTQENMEYFREKMVLEIVRGELLR